MSARPSRDIQPMIETKGGTMAVRIPLPSVLLLSACAGAMGRGGSAIVSLSHVKTGAGIQNDARHGLGKDFRRVPGNGRSTSPSSRRRRRA